MTSPVLRPTPIRASVRASWSERQNNNNVQLEDVFGEKKKGEIEALEVCGCENESN